MTTTPSTDQPAGGAADDTVGADTDVIERRVHWSASQRVPVNAYETTDALVIVAPMPGVMPEDVEVVVRGTEVVLHARLRAPAPREYLLHEWDYGDYERAVTIPADYRGPVHASLGNGQLAVSVARDGDRREQQQLVVAPSGPGETTR